MLVRGEYNGNDGAYCPTNAEYPEFGSNIEEKGSRGEKCSTMVIEPPQAIPSLPQNHDHEATKNIATGNEIQSNCNVQQHNYRDDVVDIAILVRDDDGACSGKRRLLRLTGGDPYKSEFLLDNFQVKISEALRRSLLKPQKALILTSCYSEMRLMTSKAQIILNFLRGLQESTVRSIKR